MNLENHKKIVRLISLFIFNRKKRKEFRSKYIKNNSNKVIKTHEEGILLNINISPPVFLSGNKLPKDSYIGKYTYFGIHCRVKKTIKVGSFCSIAENVMIAPAEHPTNLLTTHTIAYSNNLYGYDDNFKNLNFKNNFIKNNPNNYSPADKKASSKYNVIIGNDVWIGANATILSGVKIGNGAIIAANALVNKDIPAYSIVGGVPAKIIKYRFDKSTIEDLQELEWWNIDIKYFKDLDFSDIKSCIKKLKKIKSSL